ncbi:MAG: hypothetical protein ABI456_04670 [Ktedonobacteraceae bacterium]|nr:hypothetical protein [Chloroflexota bacterium]
MDLLDRYVRAVKTYLPRAQQDDIVKELSANLYAQMEDREAELGRHLTEAEDEELLKQHGHPLLVAERYQTNQGRLVFGRQLIGPALFPWYVKVLSFTMGISVPLSLLVQIVLAQNGVQITLDGILTRLVIQIIVQFAIITSLFAAVQNSLPLFRWNKERQPERPAAGRAGQAIPRGESIAQIIVNLVVLSWFWGVFQTPSLLVGLTVGNYQLGPMWYQIVVPSLLVIVVSITQAVINLFRPAWTRFRQAMRLVTDSAALLIVVFLLRAGNWVVLVHPNGPGGSSLGTINTYVSYALWITLIGIGIAVLVDAWKLIRGELRRAVPAWE